MCDIFHFKVTVSIIRPNIILIIISADAQLRIAFILIYIITFTFNVISWSKSRNRKYLNAFSSFCNITFSFTFDSIDISDIIKAQFLLWTFVFQTACSFARQIDKLTVLGHVRGLSRLNKISKSVSHNWRRNWKWCGGGSEQWGSEYSWVSGSDRASMIGDVRSLQYEVWFEQPVWREEGEWVSEKKTWGRENRERGE